MSKLATIKKLIKEEFDYFFKVIPNIPFKKKDVQIIYITGSNIKDSMVTFASKYAPEKIPMLENNDYASIDGKTIIGNETSAIFLNIEDLEEIEEIKRVLRRGLIYIYLPT